MRKSRAALAGVAVAAGLVVGTAMVPSEASNPDAEPETPVTPATPPSTAAPPAELVSPLPPLPAAGLDRGSTGDAVQALEARLQVLRYDPGPVDGSFDAATEFAVMAFEKVHDLAPTGHVDDLVWAALEGGRGPEPLMPAGGARRVEIDLDRQLLFYYDGGRLGLVTHISSGSGIPYCQDGICGSAVTPVGAHRFMWRVNGWRTSRLGRLYNPVYFTAYGIAVHGFGSVPAHPASHGCVRIPMHVADYFPSLVDKGDPVYVLDGETDVQPISTDTSRGTDGTGEPTDDGPPEAPAGRLDGDPPPATTTTTPGTLA